MTNSMRPDLDFTKKAGVIYVYEVLPARERVGIRA